MKTGSSSGNVESGGSIESSSSSSAVVVDARIVRVCVCVVPCASVVVNSSALCSDGAPSLTVFERERAGSSGSSVSESGLALACCSGA